MRNEEITKKGYCSIMYDKQASKLLPFLKIVFFTKIKLRVLKEDAI